MHAVVANQGQCGVAKIVLNRVRSLSSVINSVTLGALNKDCPYVGRTDHVLREIQLCRWLKLLIYRKHSGTVRRSLSLSFSLSLSHTHTESHTYSPFLY
jgi:hypothetical protein